MVDVTALERLDSFPYKHRVTEVMGTPLVTTPVNTTIGAASAVMASAKISSLVAVDPEGRPAGIVTERDVLQAVADHQGAAPALPLARVMSSPVATVRHDAFVYVAMGRMDRLKIRHLVVVDESGCAVGVITARGLLHLRAGLALSIGDQIATAEGAPEMAAVRANLPALARSMLAEGIDARGVAAVTSSVLRDMTARAARLAEASMAGEPEWGPPPAPFCVLLLGSGGRRESLFGADQDNAIVHGGTEEDDAWFAEAGRRMTEILDQAGVPLCKGGVMARNRQWRHTIDGWRAEIDRWIKDADGPELLNIDIFVDFRPVYGRLSLAEPVREHLVSHAGASHRFLHAMAGSVSEMRAPLGVLGQFKTKDGRLDIKTGGILPLVSAVRLLALKHRIPATGTGERMKAMIEAGHMSRAEAEGLCANHGLMVRILLEQQIADSEAGIPLSNRIDPKRLSTEDRNRLKDCFKSINSLGWVLQNALSSV